jgi:ubiquinone/menaquinone biosynthesis C-methylase UbiE
MSTTERKLVNVGCGHQRPAGWINTDCSLNAMIQRVPVLGTVITKAMGSTEYGSGNVSYLNLTKRWPFGDASIDVVYGSHVFEHLSISGSRHFLKEALRVLKPGGVLRLVVPDLYQAAKTYVTKLESGDPKASEPLLFTLNLHRENTYPTTKSLPYQIAHWFQDWPHQHKYMYDAPTLTALMESHGVVNVKPTSYGVSELIPEIHDVEQTAEGIPAIYLEGSKPC